MQDIILVGYGGHAASVADSIEAGGQYRIIGYTDVKAQEVAKYRYLGTDDCLPVYYDKGIRNLAFGIGYMGKGKLRDNIYVAAKKWGFEFPVIIDPSAVLAGDVTVSEGVFIGKKAVVNSKVNIGKCCIINTGAVIEHGNTIGDFTHIAVGAVLCGNVAVGAHSMIGANATVLQDMFVGENTIVGAGAVVNKDIKADCLAVGIPARIIKTRNEE